MERESLATDQDWKLQVLISLRTSMGRYAIGLSC